MSRQVDEHQVAELGGLAQEVELLGALDRPHLLQHVVEATMLAFGQERLEARENVVRQPAVRIERAGEPVHADPAPVELELA